jgi:MbtH protein
MEDKYQVVINVENQYSIWRLGRALPMGWRSARFEGTKEQCLAHIGSVWTDMRPLSLRLQMERLQPK